MAKASVSGDTAVIGDCDKTINSQFSRGAAYAIVRSGGVWSQQQELTASDGAADDFFGFSRIGEWGHGGNRG